MKKTDETKGQKRSDSGFTLLEVLIAMAIFAIGILGVASMQISATQGNGSARMATEASEFGQQQVELIMATPFNNLAVGTPPPTVNNGYTATQVIANALDAGGNPIAGVLDITITVTDPMGNQRASYRFLRANRI